MEGQTDPNMQHKGDQQYMDIPRKLTIMWNKLMVRMAGGVFSSSKKMSKTDSSKLMQICYYARPAFMWILH